MSRLLVLTLFGLFVNSFAAASVIATLEATPPPVSLRVAGGSGLSQSEPTGILGVEFKQINPALPVIGNGPVQILPGDYQHFPPMLTNEPEQPLYICIFFTLFAGSLTRLLTSRPFHKFLAAIYDPLNW